MRAGAVAVAVVLTLATALPTLADLSIFGPTGLLRVPTVDTIEAAGMEFGAHLVTDEVFTATMAVGVIDRLELSAGYVNPDNGPSDAIISGKWRVFGEFEGEEDFGLCVGVFDLTDELNRTAFFSAEKHFEVGETKVRGVAGWGESNSLVDGLYAGAEIFLGRNYSALVEYDGDDVNAALRWPFGERMKVSVGSVVDELYVGAQYVLR